jgi:phospholipase/carboxylesterase
MSGRLLDVLLVDRAEPERLQGLPMFLAHGTSDSVIPIEMGRQMRDALSALPVDLTYREYTMGHHVTQQSIADIRSWLSARLTLPDWRSASA